MKNFREKFLDLKKEKKKKKRKYFKPESLISILLPSGGLSTYHITSTGELIIHQALQSHPPNRPVFIVPQTVIVHGEQVSGEGVVCDLNLKCIINAEK